MDAKNEKEIGKAKCNFLIYCHSFLLSFNLFLSNDSLMSTDCLGMQSCWDCRQRAQFVGNR